LKIEQNLTNENQTIPQSLENEDIFELYLTCVDGLLQVKYKKCISHTQPKQNLFIIEENLFVI